MFDFNPLCPLDGRYASLVHELRPFFTEEALIAARVHIEVKYLEFLIVEQIDPKQLPLSLLNPLRTSGLDRLTQDEIARVKKIELQIKHDVKAVEYYLCEKITALNLSIPVQFVHFGLTSEDVTNLAYGHLIHQAIRKVSVEELRAVINTLLIFAINPDAKAPLLGMTHGQPATPTTLLEQISVYQERLNQYLQTTYTISLDGKFGGAVGNLSAHKAAYPEINWPTFGAKFVKSLGLNPLKCTTQINPHDDIARLSHLMQQINVVLLDLCVDMWLYISRGVLCEKATSGEVGSSTMPNKVNPIDWENAEGNLGLSNALFGHFADKLPRSRLQRDLSDSTVQRSLGLAFGYQLVAFKSIQKGLAKLEINKEACLTELAAHPEVHAEAIQTIMRRFGYADAYEQLKNLTRGQQITFQVLHNFVANLDKIPDETKQRLYKIISSNYS